MIKFEQRPATREADFFLQVSKDLLHLAVSSNAKILYLHLLSYCKRDVYQCWPSQALLAEETGWTERTIRALVKELEAAGAITIDPPRLPLRSHNIYTLNLVAERLHQRKEISGRPEKSFLPTGKNMSNHRKQFSYESHDELHDHVRERDHPLEDSSDITQNASDQGYVALLVDICGSVESATRVAALVHPSRNEEYVRNCIEYAKTCRNPPGWLTTVFKSNGLAPAPAATSGHQRPPAATRKDTSGNNGLKGWKDHFNRQKELTLDDQETDRNEAL